MKIRVRILNCMRQCRPWRGSHRCSSNRYVEMREYPKAKKAGCRSGSHGRTLKGLGTVPPKICGGEGPCLRPPKYRGGYNKNHKKCPHPAYYNITYPIVIIFQANFPPIHDMTKKRSFAIFGSKNEKILDTAFWSPQTQGQVSTHAIAALLRIK